MPRSLPSERKRCGFCPRPIYPDQPRVHRAGKDWHATCWPKAKRRDPSLEAKEATKEATKEAAKHAAPLRLVPPPPAITREEYAQLRERYERLHERLRQDYDVLLDAFDSQERRTARMEQLLDAFTRAVATYIATPQPEAVRPVRTESATPVTTPPEPVAPVAPSQRGGRGKSRVGGDRPLTDLVVALLRGRPVEGLTAQRLFEMLRQKGVRPKNASVVSATLSILQKANKVRRIRRGVYILTDGEVG